MRLDPPVRLAVHRDKKTETSRALAEAGFVGVFSVFAWTPIEGGGRQIVLAKAPPPTYNTDPIELRPSRINEAALALAFEAACSVADGRPVIAVQGRRARIRSGDWTRPGFNVSRDTEGDVGNGPMSLEFDNASFYDAQRLRDIAAAFAEAMEALSKP